MWLLDHVDKRGLHSLVYTVGYYILHGLHQGILKMRNRDIGDNCKKEDNCREEGKEKIK